MPPGHLAGDALHARPGPARGSAGPPRPAEVAASPWPSRLALLVAGLSLLVDGPRALAASPPEAPPAAAPVAATAWPRSSIAAVLVRQADLGLDAAQVKALEARDETLQRETADLRASLAAPRRAHPGDAHGAGRGGPGGAEGPSPSSPAAGARPEGAAGGSGGHRAGATGGGHRGGERSAGAPARPRSPQAQLDDADTAAWLAAEAELRPEQREAARAVAEAYREALADQREAARGRPPGAKDAPAPGSTSAP